MCASASSTCVEVARPFADDDGEFDLPVESGRSAGLQHVVERADDGVGCLVEQDRMLRRGGAGLRGVRGVVHADAEHGLGAGDGGADPQPGDVCCGQVWLCFLYPGDPVGGEERAVDVGGDAAEVPVGAVGQGQHRSLGAHIADPHEPHLVSFCGQAAVRPPSMTSAVPVTKAASSDAR